MANTVEIDLPENLTVANIHPIHEQLEAMVDDQSHDQIVIHAGSVNRADTAGIQLLYAFVVAARDRQIVLSWDQPTSKLINAIDILGMTEAIGIH